MNVSSLFLLTVCIPLTSRRDLLQLLDVLGVPVAHRVMGAVSAIDLYVEITVSYRI